MNTQSFPGYAFTLTNGKVTAMQAVFGSHNVDLKLPTGASFTVAGKSITETLSQASSTRTLQYDQDPSNASLYHLDISTTVIPNPTVTYDNGRTLGYAFTISGGAVTGMQLQVSDGNHSHTTTLPVVPTSSFTVAGNVVNETLVFGNVVENIRYVPSGTSGLYAIASLTDTFISAGTATTLLDVEPFERAAFTLDANKAVTQVQSVAVDGTHKTVAIGSNVYTQLAPGFILETQKDGSTSRYEVFHDGNGDGVYTAVAHGSGTTIDLVGLKAQISAAMDGVL